MNETNLLKERESLPRRKNIRLKGYDYSNANWYFVTICAHSKKKLFGNVIKTKVRLNTIGKIIDETWKEIPLHYQNAELDYYVIMPNHFHGILILNELKHRTGEACLAPTLGNIIGSFKSASSKRIHKAHVESLSIIWQRNYYEHIIRNEKDLYNIRKYIELNPLKWELDENYVP
ncbi:MAG: transposase [Bacteroidetes bacterium]|nr:transposase [Bacteroidota bacterium]